MSVRVCANIRTTASSLSYILETWCWESCQNSNTVSSDCVSAGSERKAAMGRNLKETPSF